MLDGSDAAASFVAGAFARVLSPGASIIGDGYEITGRDACATHLATLFAIEQPDSVRSERVNGEPGVALRREGQVRAVLVLAMGTSFVERVWIITDPGKLRAWNFSN